jgi:hypothetical protein
VPGVGLVENPVEGASGLGKAWRTSDEARRVDIRGKSYRMREHTDLHGTLLPETDAA